MIFSYDFGDGTREFVAAGTIQNSLEIWDPISGKVIRKGLGHSGSIFCIRYFNGFVFTGSDDRSVKIWNLQKTRINNHSEANVRTCAIIGYSRMVAAPLRIYDKNNSLRIHKLPFVEIELKHWPKTTLMLFD